MVICENSLAIAKPQVGIKLFNNIRICTSYHVGGGGEEGRGKGAVAGCGGGQGTHEK